METTLRYSAHAKRLHWLMAAVISITWFVGIYSAHFRSDATHVAAIYVHKSIATTVLFLFVVRLVYRLTHRYPPLPDSVDGVSALLAKGVHVLLYVLAMCALPLSGWYWSSVAGRPAPVLGLFNLPALSPKNPGMSDTGMWTHRILAWTVGALIFAHALAALKHHFVDRDDILIRMLPGKQHWLPRWTSRTHTRD